MASPPDPSQLIKAKFRLTAQSDYDRLVRITSSRSPPVSKRSSNGDLISSAFEGDDGRDEFQLTRIYTEQDYIFDGKSHDLWHAGLTLAIRHSVERYPQQGPQSVCKVALKETSFKELVGLDGHLLALDQLNGAPFYEVKERSELVDYRSVQALVDHGEILSSSNCAQSSILSSTLNRYYIEDGISCIGSFISLRHEFRWLKMEGQPLIEVDKCSFPHGEGYYVQFPPDERIVSAITGFLKSSGVSYSMNTMSKTELFFQGLDMINSMALRRTTDPSTLSPQLASNASDQTSSIGSSLPDDQSLAEYRSTNNDQQESDDNNSVAPPQVFRVTVSNLTAQLNHSRGLGSEESIKSPTAAGTADTQRRGRKSLQLMLAEAAANPERMLTNIPKQLLKAFNEMGIDLSKVQPQEVPELVNQYNRYRNSVASAKYRKRKLEQTNTMAEELDRIKAELETYRRRCQNLEAELAMLKASRGMSGTRK